MATNNNLTDYGERDTVGYWGSAWTLYAALMSVAGGETGGAGTEFDAADYERKEVTWRPDPTDDTRLINDLAAIAFGTPAEDWGEAVEVRLFDAATDGEEKFYYTLSPAVDCVEGAPVRIPVSSIIQRAQ